LPFSRQRIKSDIERFEKLLEDVDNDIKKGKESISRMKTGKIYMKKLRRN
jgi:hypothetical protein